LGIRIFDVRRDSKGRKENSPVDCFYAVGESLKAKRHPERMWIGFENDVVFLRIPIWISAFFRSGIAVPSTKSG